MFSQMLKSSFLRSASVLGHVAKNRTQARYLATVQSTERAAVNPQRRSTPISTERATFTIKVHKHPTQCKPVDMSLTAF